VFSLHPTDLCAAIVEGIQHVDLTWTPFGLGVRPPLCGK